MSNYLGFYKKETLKLVVKIKENFPTMTETETQFITNVSESNDMTFKVIDIKDVKNVPIISITDNL